MRVSSPQGYGGANCDELAPFVFRGLGGDENLARAPGFRGSAGGWASLAQSYRRCPITSIGYVNRLRMGREGFH